MENEYDFIIVGSGPSGCVLASRLARSSASPRVLLIEAGSENSNSKHQISSERFFTHATAEGYNWGYKTVHQQHLNGRQLDYSRGRGLGGSSAINFSVYVRGPKDDYDEWARLVDDEAWTWEHVNRKFNMIEDYGEVSNDLKPYINIPYSSHGHDGPLNLGFAPTLEKDIPNVLKAAEDYGLPLNLDLNDGDPIGVGIPALTALRGKRVTASTAYLSKKPENLTILLESVVTGILFKDKRAIGIKTSQRNLYASKEVILSAGALDTPKILLLSGVGPSKELQRFDIEVVQDIPGIGKGLRDHCFAVLTLMQKPGTNDRATFFSNSAKIEAARRLFEEDGSGQLAHFYSAVTMGFLKSDRIVSSREFMELPKHIQEYIQRATVPHYEITSHCPPLYVNEGEELKSTDTYLSIGAFGQNPQSTGSVRLQSVDPQDNLLIDPQFLSHPYDRRTIIEAVRHVMELMDSPSLASNSIKLIGGPKDRTDEAILDYVRAAIISSWHMCGTAKMGKPDEEATCINKNFQLIGIDGLRVVDMSIAPLMTNNHTQSVAYLIGETAAEKIIKQYSLEAL